jgi:hypothetical protein
MAEACGSRTQTFNSQLTANDDVAASAKFQLESIGVRFSRVSRRKVGTMSESQIQTIWPTAKADLATVAATFATLQTQLATVETDCVALAAAGGQDVVNWLHTQLRNLGAGYTPIGEGAGLIPAVISVVAPDPNIPRQLALLGDQRGITQIHPGLT